MAISYFTRLLPGEVRNEKEVYLQIQQGQDHLYSHEISSLSFYIWQLENDRQHIENCLKISLAASSISIHPLFSIVLQLSVLCCPLLHKRVFCPPIYNNISLTFLKLSPIVSSWSFILLGKLSFKPFRLSLMVSSMVQYLPTD